MPSATTPAFLYVIVGGGVAAHEFVKRGFSLGELCIISEETVLIKGSGGQERDATLNQVLDT
nr:monodehydroascorbate reductase 4, peroxisomal [Ipomoea batatas]